MLVYTCIRMDKRTHRYKHIYTSNVSAENTTHDISSQQNGKILFETSAAPRKLLLQNSYSHITLQKPERTRFYDALHVDTDVTLE